MRTYVSGTVVRSTAKFSNLAGQPATPADITVRYQTNQDAPQDVSNAVQQDAPPIEGTYYTDLDTSGWLGPGYQIWKVEWFGTGGVQAIEDDFFRVKAGAVPQ